MIDTKKANMRRGRDPPACNSFKLKKKKSICDYSGSSLFDTEAELKVKYDRYTSLEASNSTVEDTGDNGVVETELDAKLFEEARQCMLRYKKKEEVERQLGLTFDEEQDKSIKLNITKVISDPTPSINCSEDSKPAPTGNGKRPRGSSFGEEEAEIVEELPTDVSKNDEFGKEDELTKSSVSSFEEEAVVKPVGTMFHGENSSSCPTDEGRAKKPGPEEHADDKVTDQNMMIVHETAADDVDSSDPHAPMPGFWITLFEFLTCAIANLCDTNNAKKDISGTLEYEIPLQSVQDADDIGAWGNADTEQESLKPTRIAKAINFSSKRLDEPNAGIALYDEVKLRQEVHKVEIPDEYFDYDEEAEDICEELSYVRSRGVPDAVVVKPKKVDDVSVLEDNSVDDSFTDARSVQAWSLSPRRKRRLRARARAGASKEN